MNFLELQLKIEKAARKAFEEIRARHADQRLCGYALYTDSDAITVCPAANSERNLNRMMADDPDDSVYYRWSPGEWDHEFEGAQHFEEISALLEKEVGNIVRPQHHAEFKSQVHEACVLALENLRREGYFSNNSVDTVVVFGIGGGESEKEKDWIARLNDPLMAAQFIEWVT